MAIHVVDLMQSEIKHIHHIVFIPNELSYLLSDSILNMKTV